MYSRWGEAELLGLSSQMTGAARLNSATGRLSEAAALTSALTPSELASLTNSAAVRQHQAAVAAHYGLTPASALHGGVQLVSAPGGGYQAIVAAPGVPGQVPMASRLLYGATAAESALLRQRTQAEKYAQQQQTAQVYRDQASREPTPSHAPPSSREGRRIAQQEEEHLVKSVRHELDRKLKSKPHQVIEIVDDDDDEEEEAERPVKSSRSSSSKKKRRHMGESPEMGSTHKKRKHKEHKEQKEKQRSAYSKSLDRMPIANLPPIMLAPIPADRGVAQLSQPPPASRTPQPPPPSRTPQPPQPQRLSHGSTIQSFLKTQLMNEVVKNDAERSVKLMNSVVEHVRGGSPAAVQPGARYPPHTLEVSVPVLKQVVSMVEGDVYRHLSQSLDRVFDKAEAEKIFNTPAEQAPPAPTPTQPLVAPLQPPPMPQVDAAAAAEIASLRREVASLKSHLAQLKVNHSRSIRAYMRASVDSLRAYRKSVEEEVVEVTAEVVEAQQ